MRAYIADFGLATLTDFGCATTLVGSAIMGTPRRLAPELIPHAQDAQAKRRHTYASDIYAFALVCYEASYFPFHCGNPV
jgi:serine/threonine protein kinase